MKFLSFLQDSDGAYSWGRVIGTVTAFTACWSLIYVVIKNHQIPDAATLGGLAAFGGFGYALSKGLTAFARPQNTDKL
jgi:hypothetical protein